MQITDLLAQSGGLESIARELGVTKEQAAAGAAALAPAILGGFKKQTEAQRGGAAGLGGLLAQLGGGALLDDVLAPEPTNVNRGNEVLGQIFGSKDVSRAVAQNAAAQSGLDSSVLKKMLPILAMLLTGYMARKGGATTGGSSMGGGLGDLLGGLLGGRSGGAAGGGGAVPGGHENPLEDILRKMAKKS